MNSLSFSIDNIINYLKTIPEPYSVDGIIGAFSVSIENEKLINNFALYFFKDGLCNLWYHSKQYIVEDYQNNIIKSVIEKKKAIKHNNVKIYPLVARNVSFGVIVIEAKNYIFESKRFSFLIDYFSIILYTEKLSFQANKDKLTSLYNRGYILKLLSDYKKQNKEYAIIMIDLDRFKHYNDKYGHNTGDHILKLSSEKMKQSLKNISIPTTLARYGGEEFMVVVGSCLENEIKNIMELLRKTVEETDFSTDDYALHATISLGASLSLYDTGITNIIEYADKALYNSKNSGRNMASICYKDNCYSFLMR